MCLSLHLLIYVVIIVLFLEPEHALQLDDLLTEVSVLGLASLDGLLVVIDGGGVLLLPLVEDALLHHHDLVGLLLAHLRPLLRLQQRILQLRDLQVALIVQLIHSVVVQGLQTLDLRERYVLLISQSVH